MNISPFQPPMPLVPWANGPKNVPCNFPGCYFTCPPGDPNVMDAHVRDRHMRDNRANQLMAMRALAREAGKKNPAAPDIKAPLRRQYGRQVA